MLLEHKQIINQMRQEGRSQLQIAATLGIPYNTVKSYCRRNNIIPIQNGSPKTICYKSVEKAGVQTICKHCGKALIQALKGQPKKFCSEDCRRTWWKSNESQSSRKAYYNLICSKCKKEFKSYGNKNRKFCSHGCYINHRFINGGDKHDA